MSAGEAVGDEATSGGLALSTWRGKGRKTARPVSGCDARCSATVSLFRVQRCTGCGPFFKLLPSFYSSHCDPGRTANPNGHGQKHLQTIERNNTGVSFLRAPASTFPASDGVCRHHVRWSFCVSPKISRRQGMGRTCQRGRKADVSRPTPTHNRSRSQLIVLSAHSHFPVCDDEAGFVSLGPHKVRLLALPDSPQWYHMRGGACAFSVTARRRGDVQPSDPENITKKKKKEWFRSETDREGDRWPPGQC